MTAKLTGKAERKMRKRSRIAARVITQKKWIEVALGITLGQDDKRLRHCFFSQARKIIEGNLEDERGKYGSSHAKR